MRIPFLSARWHHLAVLNYAVDPGLLESYVPAGTELDFHEGNCLLSLVGFRFLRTRVLGVPVPFHRNFEEVNLRFYVRRQTDEGWRRGVVFIKEVVPKRAITAMARGVYNENYITCPMYSQVCLPDAETNAVGWAEYGWQGAGGEHVIQLRCSGRSQEMLVGSEEEFILEHYYGYTRQANGETLEYRVDHPSWRYWSVQSAGYQGDAASFYGPEFAEVLTAEPRSAQFVDGSKVAVFFGRRGFSS